MNSKRGAALLIVLVFLLLGTILAAALLSSATGQARLAGRQVNLERALLLADAGVERATKVIEDQFGYLPQTTRGNGTVGGGTYAYTIEKTGRRVYSVVATGVVNYVSRVVRLSRVYLPTWAKYALWMDQNGEIYFIPGEEFYGHVHSNSKLWFSCYGGAGPHFWAECTSGASTYGGTTNYCIFARGFELNAEEGEMADVDFETGTYSLKGLASGAAGIGVVNGLVLQGHTWIRLTNDTMRIYNARRNPANFNWAVGDDQIVYVDRATTGPSTNRQAMVYLQGGVLRGRLTIVAEDDIQIQNHIRYYTNPETTTNLSNDSLGLIAKDDVLVATTAPNNLQIFAAILATGQYAPSDHGSFGVINYDTGPTRGRLHVFGSIVQDVRGAVGTFDNNGPRTGYYKDYRFDTRFVTNAPPYYPVLEDQVGYTGWSEAPPT
jgi:hypothetical protein